MNLRTLVVGNAIILALIAASHCGAAQQWTIGSRVHASAPVYARSDTLGLGVKTLRLVGDKGTIVRGPTGATSIWGVSWYVHYDTPPDGWSTQQYLALDSLAVPPPPPPVSGGALRTVALTGLPVSIGVTVGQAVEYAALPLDSTNTLTAAPVTWSATDSTVVKLTHPFLGLSQAIGLTALRVGTTTVTASAAGLTRSMGFSGLPLDTTTTPYLVTGLQVTNLPRRPYYDFLGPKLIYSGPYFVNLIGVAQDTLKHAVCVVPK